MRVDGENLQLHNFTFKVNTYRQSLKYERASRNVLSPLKLEIKINLIIIVGGFWMELEWRGGGLISPKHCEKNKIIFFLMFRKFIVNQEKSRSLGPQGKIAV